MKPLKDKQFEKQKGMSLVETLPIIIAIASLFAFLFGFWSLSHRYILSSIAARNYAFSTFTHRSNLLYFNDTRSTTHSYEKSQVRFHGIGPGTSGNSIKAYSLKLKGPLGSNVTRDLSNVHRNRLWLSTSYQEKGAQAREISPNVRVTQPWVLVNYGICLTAQCGGG